MPEPIPDVVDAIIAQWNREAPELPVDNIAILGRLHRCNSRYQALLTEEVNAHGLGAAGFDVLAALRRSGPDFRRTSGQLATVGLISTGGLTQRIDRLEHDGFVERQRDPDDRRVVYVQLTERGRELVDSILTSHFEEQERMVGFLSAAERRQLARLLAVLEASLAHTARRRLLDAQNGEDAASSSG
jgi:DNA-binding MarR family transcriptional regulator